MLIYPNITRSKEIFKDSYVVLLPYIIDTLCKINKQLHITYLLPSKLIDKSDGGVVKHGSQVEWKYYEVPTNNNTMRTNFFFDAQTLKDISDYRNTPYDILYTHLPEHTLQLTNLLMNDSHSDGIRTFGYSHWFETSASVSFTKKMLLMNMVGILECETLGVNSNWLKNYVTKQSKRWFSDEILADLDRIIQPHQLGVDKVDFTPKRYKGKKIILFNHRGKGYTNFKGMCEAMSKLYKKRQDFEVHTTFDDANVSRYKWGKNMNYPTQDEYKKYLKDNVYLHINTFKTYSAWSISTTDCLALGIPTVAPNGLCYEEMVGSDYPLLYKKGDMDDFISKVEMVLDSPKFRSQVLKKLEPRIKKMVWGKQIRSWLDWNDMFDPSKYKMDGKDTKKVKLATKLIKQHKVVSNTQLIREMRLGGQSSFGRTRNRLRLNKKIKFLANGYEWVG